MVSSERTKAKTSTSAHMLRLGRDELVAGAGCHERGRDQAAMLEAHEDNRLVRTSDGIWYHKIGRSSTIADALWDSRSVKLRDAGGLSINPALSLRELRVLSFVLMPLPKSTHVAQSYP